MSISDYDRQLYALQALPLAGSTPISEGPNVEALRNGYAPQAYYVYNTYTDANNFERGIFDWISAPNTLTIGTAAAGTGIARTLRFVTNSEIDWILSGVSKLALTNISLTPFSAGGVSLGQGSTNSYSKLYIDYTNTATVGAVTINKAAGRVNVAASGASIVVTNSFCTPSSKVFAQVSSADATAYIKNVVPGNGSFTINLGATATAQASIDFFIVSAD